MCACQAWKKHESKKALKAILEIEYSKCFEDVRNVVISVLGPKKNPLKGMKDVELRIGISISGLSLWLFNFWLTASITSSIISSLNLDYAVDGIIENVMEESNNKKEETVRIADAP